MNTFILVAQLARRLCILVCSVTSVICANNAHLLPVLKMHSLLSGKEVYQVPARGIDNICNDNKSDRKLSAFQFFFPFLQ